MPKIKRLLVVSDFHCGHDVGLTHPGWDAERERRKLSYLYEIRRRIWDFYSEHVRAFRPHIVIANGDLVDGKGEASGGVEQIYIDMNDQVELAVAALQECGRPKYFLSYGTPYHTGRDLDFEDQIAREIGAEKIGGEDTINATRLMINYRHYVGRSSVPHSRHTAVARERLWNKLWAMRGEYPAAHVLIRSHVHYHTFCGGSDWVAMTTPALQGYGTKYGGRRMTGTVDIGMIFFEIQDKDSYSWKPVLLRLPYKEPLEA